MIKFWILILRSCRKVYIFLFNSQFNNPPECELDPDKVSEKIYNLLISNDPCMITRFGAVEISALYNYLGVTNKTSRNIFKFIKGETPEWYWNEGVKYTMSNNAGFFPSDNKNLVRFGDLMMDSINSIDILGSWLPLEKYFIKNINNERLVNIYLLDPFWSKNPWTKALEGKKILVIHPFSDLIEYQYHNNKDNLFINKSILPSFELITLKAIQPDEGKEKFQDWFEALEYMKSKIDTINFDICLLGCGAYGLPLASYIKSIGKKAIHIGGPLQLLFGIWGKRWDNPQYASKILKKNGVYLTLKNEHWVHPDAKHRPKNYLQIENGCYW